MFSTFFFFNLLTNGKKDLSRLQKWIKKLKLPKEIFDQIIGIIEGRLLVNGTNPADKFQPKVISSGTFRVRL
jgi:hypothetical protein